MKPLKKHPKQQRMEDMTFPLQKVDPNPKSLGFTVAVKKSLDEGTKTKKDMTFPITKPLTSNGRDVCVGDLKKDEEYEAYWDGVNWIIKDKVTWTGREWLRSINDDRHGWHVLGWVILGVAVIISLKIVL